MLCKKHAPGHLKRQFQRYVKSACSLLQARGAFRDTDELRYLLLTWWPSFKQVAESQSLQNFVEFLRSALRHPRLLLAEVRATGVFFGFCYAFYACFVMVKSIHMLR